MSHVVAIVLVVLLVSVLVGLCAGPYVGFNRLPSGDDEEHKN